MAAGRCCNRWAMKMGPAGRECPCICHVGGRCPDSGPMTDLIQGRAVMMTLELLEATVKTAWDEGFAVGTQPLDDGRPGSSADYWLAIKVRVAEAASRE